jgi:hypothetical protein
MASPFVARIDGKKHHPPIRAYAYREGLNEAFGDLDGACRYLRQVLTDYRRFSERADFLFAAVWGDNKDKIAEMFSYWGINTWPGNPEEQPWVIKNGVYQPTAFQENGIYFPTATSTKCESTSLLFNGEHRYRRLTNNPKEFFSSYPYLGEFEPDVSVEL